MKVLQQDSNKQNTNNFEMFSKGLECTSWKLFNMITTGKMTKKFFTDNYVNSLKLKPKITIDPIVCISVNFEPNDD